MGQIGELGSLGEAVGKKDVGDRGQASRTLPERSRNRPSITAHFFLKKVVLVCIKNYIFSGKTRL